MGAGEFQSALKTSLGTTAVRDVVALLTADGTQTGQARSARTTRTAARAAGGLRAAMMAATKARYAREAAADTKKGLSATR